MTLSQVGIHPFNANLLHLFSNRFDSFGWRLGVTSYIGYHSFERRAGLERSVREFNQSRDGPGRLGLRILSTRDKSEFLQQAGTSVHVDDRHDGCGIQTMHVCQDGYRSRHTNVISLAQALDRIVEIRPEARLHEFAFEGYWPFP